MRWYIIAIILGALIVIYVMVNPLFQALFKLVGL